MGIDGKFLVTAPKPRRTGGGRAVIFVCLVLLAGVAWLGWKRDWLGRGTTDRAGMLMLTNTPAPTTSTISTTIVTRPIQIPTPNNSNRLDALSLVDAQVALDRLAISPGSIDGINGSQTRAALRTFQLREGMPATGALDAETGARLSLSTAALKNYRVEAADLARLLPMATTWLGKSEQPRLDFESVLELVAEKHHAHPNLLRRLNPTLDWNAVSPGAEIIVPGVERELSRAKAAFIQIRLGERTLQVFDSTNRLLAHFPCSIARHAEKRPVGELHVAVVAPNPDYTFTPELFPESAEARELKTKLKLPPGPNNPVGTAWIGLDLPGYGIHGTPKPEEVGRTESHGCFRLANWNAEYLLRLVTIGMPVRVEP